LTRARNVWTLIPHCFKDKTQQRCNHQTERCRCMWYLILELVLYSTKQPQPIYLLRRRVPDLIHTVTMVRHSICKYKQITHSLGPRLCFAVRRMPFWTPRSSYPWSAVLPNPLPQILSCKNFVDWLWKFDPHFTSKLEILGPSVLGTHIVVLNTREEFVSLPEDVVSFVADLPACLQENGAMKGLRLISIFLSESSTSS